MGMSTNLQGFVSPDNETYIKHSKVLRACIDAKIKKLPEETAKYFDNDWPREYLFDEKLEVSVPYSEWSDGDMQVGFEIIVADIPEGVHTIRFYNSY